jgi:patatin-like phospholipase/acyl hydrolase
MRNKKYKVVLSIDGGGIKGVVPLVILDHIVENFRTIGKNVIIPDLVDLFAGSSTGSIICASLMHKTRGGQQQFKVKDVLQLYLKKGPQIFKKEFSEYYNRRNNPLKVVLQRNFGSTMLSDLYPEFMFLSYDLISNEPYLFSKKSSDISEITLAESLIASTAVPGYYPPIKMRHYELADGMLACKNPGKFAYNYAKLCFPGETVLMISLGTGYKKDERKDWVEEDVCCAHEYLHNISEIDRDFYYLRLQPELKRASSDIDDTSQKNMTALVDDTLDYISTDAHFGRLFDLMKIKFGMQAARV